MNLEVVPFTTVEHEKFQVIVFEEAAVARKGKGRTAVVKEDERQVTRLKRELEATREYLQSIIEEQEAMNEELRSANEEIQSSNEELQSTNEELETAKEELQSSNEELTTLNEELENRNEELNTVNNDLLNILTSVEIPIVILDNDLRIRRFNPGAQRSLNLVPSDIGRVLMDVKTTLVVDELGPVLQGVLETPAMRELEVKDRSGRSTLLRVRPYKTMDNKIDGVVMVLFDLTDLRTSKSA